MNRFHDADSVESLIHQIIGAGSMCWENLRSAGVFLDRDARAIAKDGMARLDELRSDDVYVLTEALRLTVEYVTTATLPPIEGWSWYDAMLKYRPEVATQMLDLHKRHVEPTSKRPLFVVLGLYRYLPVDPVTGEVSAADDAITMGRMRHCDVPEMHRRNNCEHVMDDHHWFDDGSSLGIVVCPS